MSQKNRYLYAILVPAMVVGGAILFRPTPAYAYILPALGLLSYLAGPAVAVLGALALVLLWPLRALIRKLKKKKAVPPEGAAHEKD